MSLFIAGFFSAGFARKLVDIDYHIAMGGRAYGTLAETCPPARGRTLRQVFAELAAKFVPMVDALNEISESSYQHSDQDRLRLYELWVKTGSERSRQLLRKLGLEPAPARAQPAGALMSAGTLASLQGALAEIYDLPATPDVADFLLTDRARLAQLRGARQRRTAPRRGRGRHAVDGAVHRRRRARATGAPRSVQPRSHTTISPTT